MIKGLTTHNILTAVGHKPAGFATGTPDVAVAPVKSPEVLVKKSRRINYVPNKADAARLAPGVVKLTVGDPTGYRDLDDYHYKPSADFSEALVVASHMYEQAQMPHQWKKDPLPEDNSGNEIEEYFNHISEEQMNVKVEALKEQGFTYPQINAAIARMREREIDKALKNPFIRPSGVPGVLHKVYQGRRGRSNSAGARRRVTFESDDDTHVTEISPVATPARQTIRIRRSAPQTELGAFRTPGAVAERLGTPVDDTPV